MVLFQTENLGTEFYTAQAPSFQLPQPSQSPGCRGRGWGRQQSQSVMGEA